MGQKIKIVRSHRRRKTIQLRERGDELILYVPSGLSDVEEKKWLRIMLQKHERRKKKQDYDIQSRLEQRAAALNRQYFDGSLSYSIAFVTNQNKRFGSCSTHKKMIRISDRVLDMPVWVQDYIIVHELAHLLFPDHSKEFWNVVNRYRYAERAKGYLIAIAYLSGKEIDEHV